MNFDFSDDQKLLRDQARKFLFDKCDRKSVRTVLDDDQLHYHKELWSQISEMGWTGTAIPEEYGGLGLGMLELCVIAEELGRSLAPTPFSSSIYLFAEFIKNYGSEDQKKKLISIFKKGIKIEELSQRFNCSKLTIVRNLKKNLGESKYKEIITNNKKLLYESN